MIEVIKFLALSMELYSIFYVSLVLAFYFFKKQEYVVLKENDVLPVVVAYEYNKIVEITLKNLDNRFENVILLTVKAEKVPFKNVEIVKTPKYFKSKAKYKGRDLLYFARTYKTYKKYVLFLDEDSIPVFPLKVPKNADCVVFQEIPQKSGNILIDLAEMQRIAWSLEQKLFLSLNTPFYLWGGCLLIKKELLNFIPDKFSITEDTLFGWELFKRKIRFGFSELTVKTLPPSNLKSLFKQRSRWFVGTLHDLKYLENKLLKIIIYFRLFIWSMSFTFIIIFLLLPVYLHILCFIIFTIENLIACRKLKINVMYSFAWLIGALINSLSVLMSIFFYRKMKFKITEKRLK